MKELSITFQSLVAKIIQSKIPKVSDIAKEEVYF